MYFEFDGAISTDVQAMYSASIPLASVWLMKMAPQYLVLLPQAETKTTMFIFSQF